jgi:hypothetical protein
MKNLRFKLTSLTATLGCALALAAPASASAAATNQRRSFCPAGRRRCAVALSHGASREAHRTAIRVRSKRRTDGARVRQKKQPAASKPSAAKVTPRPPATTLSSTKRPQLRQPSLCSRRRMPGTNTICESGTCQAFERAVDILLYRKGRRQHGLHPVLLQQPRQSRPPRGGAALLPFLEPESHTQIVAPFYWRVEDYLKQRVVLVVGLYSQTTRTRRQILGLVALLLRLDQVRLGHTAAAFLQGWRSGPWQGLRHVLALLLVAQPRAQVRPAVPVRHLHPVETVGLHVCRSAELLLAQRRRQEPAVDSILLPKQDADRRNVRVGARLFVRREYRRPRARSCGSIGTADPSRRITTSCSLFCGASARPVASTTILPPLFHFRSKGTATGTFAFFAWWSSDEKAKSNWQLGIAFLLPQEQRRRRNRSSTCGPRAPTSATTRKARATCRCWCRRCSTGATRPTPSTTSSSTTGTTTSRRRAYDHLWPLLPSQRSARLDHLALSRSSGTFATLIPGATAHSLLPFYFRRNSPNES